MVLMHSSNPHVKQVVTKTVEVVSNRSVSPQFDCLNMFPESLVERTIRLPTVHLGAQAAGKNVNDVR